MTIDIQIWSWCINVQEQATTMNFGTQMDKSSFVVNYYQDLGQHGNKLLKVKEGGGLWSDRPKGSNFEKGPCHSLIKKVNDASWLGFREWSKLGLKRRK